MARDIETAPDETDLSRTRRARAARRVLLACFALFVLAGATGLLGVRHRTVVASAAGYTLEVNYPAVARPGLAVAWELRVRSATGFDGPLTIAVSSDYFDLFDHNVFDPSPKGERTTASLSFWEFDPPPSGSVFTIGLDARIEPGRQRGRTGTAALLVGGRPAVTVEYRTRLMP